MCSQSVGLRAMYALYTHTSSSAAAAAARTGTDSCYSSLASRIWHTPRESERELPSHSLASARGLSILSLLCGAPAAISSFSLSSLVDKIHASRDRFPVLLVVVDCVAAAASSPSPFIHPRGGSLAHSHTHLDSPTHAELYLSIHLSLPQRVCVTISYTYITISMSTCMYMYGTAVAYTLHACVCVLYTDDDDGDDVYIIYIFVSTILHILALASGACCLFRLYTTIASRTIQTHYARDTHTHTLQSRAVRACALSTSYYSPRRRAFSSLALHSLRLGTTQTSARLTQSAALRSHRARARSRVSSPTLAPPRCCCCCFLSREGHTMSAYVCVSTTKGRGEERVSSRVPRLCVYVRMYVCMACMSV